MKRLKIAAGASLVLAAMVLAGGYGLLRASLPMLDGELVLAGLNQPVTVTRDALGTPTVSAADRNDLAFATGFLHAQDRFFQMDLLRRSAAGELAELVGAEAVPLDRRTRLHGLRQVAAQVRRELPPEQARLLETYAFGVNAGLAALGARPFEYGLLATTPAPWRPEDSVLVIYAMYFDLQDAEGQREARLASLRESLPGSAFDFLTATGSSWDAALDGSQGRLPRLPAAADYDLRRQTAQAPAPLSRGEPVAEAQAVGSNNWAVGPAHSADGAAWLADDMHLGLRLPNVWYRARLEWRDADGAHAVTGLTLPGAPAVIVGSNGAVAWGFTNAYVDTADRILLELDPERPDHYRTPDGYEPFKTRRERIRIKGGAEQVLDVRLTRWGPVLGQDAQGRWLALKWLAHEPQATNLGLLGLERAESVEDALAVAARAGMPTQNLVAVDRAGNIGWTLMGRIPLRSGYDPRLPASWADGAGWRGWLPPQDYPRIVNPPQGRIWTANNRISQQAHELAGDGGYQLGARAAQIRDRLLALEAAEPQDLLALQLDDRALFLERWRTLLLDVLDTPALDADLRRRDLRAAVEAWGGRAEPGSVGYRMVRAFRLYLYEISFNALTAPVRARDPDFALDEFPQAEGALWLLVSQRPEHLKDPRYASWREQMLAAVDRVVERFWDPRQRLSQATWGDYNRLRMGHPLSQALPPLGPWLDMPQSPLAGDNHMPRVQSPSHGASQRLVVAPGREEASILHLPGGQSGHPLSPYYRRGHEAWLEGRPTPFLPGPPEHTLTLVPAGPSTWTRMSD